MTAERPARPAPPPVPPLAGAACVAAATLFAYVPALRGGFVWNDLDYVTRPALRPLSGLLRIWFKVGATEQYYPVLHSAFWLEHRLWGDAPFGYHLVNVLLHAGSACLFAWALESLWRPEGAEPHPAPSLGAWLGAGLFALHPVCVESVAWISEQKNTLSTLCYLLAALAYLDFDARRGRRAYALATACFVLAVLSKSVAATLPAALLVAFWWRRGALSWRRDARPLLPWFAIGAAAGLFTAWVEHSVVGAQGGDFGLGPAGRLLVAGRALWFYLAKLLWPAHLAFIYPRWRIDPSRPASWAYPLAALALLGALAGWARRGGRGARAGAAAAFFFAGSLFPVLGFFNIFAFIFSYVADHFQYLACLGIFAAAAGAWRRWAGLPAARGAAAAVLLLLGGLSFAQARTYADVLTFYRASLERNPASWMSHLNLGVTLLDGGSPGPGTAEIREGLRLKPDNALAEYDLGTALFAQQDLPGAAAAYRKALELEPRYAKAHYGLGNVLARAGRMPEAIAQYEAALAAAPDYDEIRGDLGAALLAAGRADEAAEQFRRALAANPGRASLRESLGAALLQAGRSGEAAEALAAALSQDPDNPDLHYNLGIALAEGGRLADAIAHFGRAAELRPDDPDAQVNLAQALADAGHPAEAAAHCRAALRLRPGFPPAQALLARLPGGS
ncbi:MAG TPA: tetratricopeptide repeat protein [Opitutaceae bacterium]|nr:tetratricopeptide repeat protein [Opitutaceae bacterium]